MDAVRLICLRHGESTDNVAGVLSSRALGAPLSDTGRTQACLAASRLRADGVVAVYCSTTSRAVQTAGILATDLGVPAVTVDGLAEYDLGECEGARDPAALARSRELMRSWIVHGDLDIRLPGGESGREVADRFGRAVRWIADRHRGRTAAVVSHVGTLTVGLLALCDDLGPDEVWDRVLPHAVPFPVEARGSGWHCVGWPGTRPAPASPG